MVGYDALETLSEQGRSLWGKSDYGVGEEWLPLYVHMADSAGVADKLWDEWVPPSTRDIVARAYDGDLSRARSLFVFLAAVHDIGKATPVFQAKGVSWRPGESGDLLWKPEHAGFVIRRDLIGCRDPTHSIAGQFLLTRYLQGHGYGEGRSGKKAATSVACVVGAHHGRFPTIQRLADANEKKLALGIEGEGSSAWVQVQDELMGCAAELAGLSPDGLDELRSDGITAAVESVLTGLVVMTDWLASDQGLFPLVPLLGGEGRMGAREASERCRRGWAGASIPPSWSEDEPRVVPFLHFFSQRFALPEGAAPRPVQTAAARIAWESSDPGIMVVEAPMGEGKTEAALCAAEMLAWRYGLGGVCVALPTMATTDAMYDRVESWLKLLPNGKSTADKDIFLAHGKARLNERFQKLVSRSRKQASLYFGGDSEDEGDRTRADDVIVSEWMLGRKRGMLANFVVCTVDQVLMGALKMKHLSLRQLALANKVIVIDECHAYDVYMRQYLHVMLQWLGCWRTPVILLSATLPVEQRDQLVESYLAGRRLNESPEGSARVMRAASSGSVARASGSGDTFEGPEEGPSSLGAKASLTTGPGTDAYPLITYSDGCTVKCEQTRPSGRYVSVSLSLIGDGVEDLVGLLSERLSEGGCAGVICDTVGRAQEVARSLAKAFGTEAVTLDHSRFMDVDRMENERRLRETLGPHATVEDGRRPRLSVTVGTQVLEQSLDIDFDLLVADVAPVDLLMQRLGRTHRHARGEGDCERPASLRAASCYLRGVSSFESQGPVFAPGLTKVYDEASLVEALAVLGLEEIGPAKAITLPYDIPRLVRTAYSEEVAGYVPDGWARSYSSQCDARRDRDALKVERAKACLLPGAEFMIGQKKTLSNLSDRVDSGQQGGQCLLRDADRGQRAVRDTQETIEVLLVRRDSDGEAALMPWVGGRGVARGETLPEDSEPSVEQSVLLAQCAVRLPLSICPLQKLDDCINELEQGCWPIVRCWQESPWLSGRLLLPMEEVEPGHFEATVMGKRVAYTRRAGLSTVQG